MKKLFIIAALLIQVAAVSGQKSIDRLFSKYADSDGFTTVTISGNLLRFSATLEDDDKERDFTARITEIRILAQKGENNNVENFHDLIMNDLNLNDYEEVMSVKEKNQDFRMLMRAEGKKVREFLVISGGEDNAVIQIKGEMTMADARRLSDDVRRDLHIHITGDEFVTKHN